MPTLAAGEVTLPAFQTAVSGQPAAYADVAWGPSQAVIHGSPDDPAPTWLEFTNDGRRGNLLWPEGYWARFVPSLKVLNNSRDLVMDAGDAYPAAS